MNDLIIIGNGFDLAHGLNTRYSDFIVDYLNTVYQKLCDGKNHEDPLIKISQNDRGLIQNTGDIKSIAQFNSVFRSNSIRLEYNSTLFEDLMNNDDKKNWVDIESLYYRYLLIYYRGLEKLNTDVITSITNQVLNLNRSIETLKTLLINYLKREINNDWPRNREIKKHFEKIYSTNSEVYVLNFNYTRLPETYVNSYTNVNYIHGDILEQNDEIIFGYGDEMDIYFPKLERLNQNDFIKHFKSHGYFMNNNYNDLSDFVNKYEYNVHIMGHSCGLSDRVLLNNVFDNPRCKNIIVYYHKISKTENDFRVKSVNISRHFKPESKHRMRTLLNFENCKPLIDI